jgi:hypothetical protein
VQLALVEEEQAMKQQAGLKNERAYHDKSYAVVVLKPLVGEVLQPRREEVEEDQQLLVVVEQRQQQVVVLRNKII